MPAPIEVTGMLTNRFVIRSVLILGLLAQFAIWAAVHRPHRPADVAGVVAGMSFSPYQRGESPSGTQRLDPAALDRDLALIAARANAIRTYGVTGGLEIVPAAAERHGLTVTLGVWVDRDAIYTERELAGAVELANRHDNIERIVVGNEVLHREDVSVAQLIAIMARLRASVRVPVGTAEPWHIWLEHPELAANVDFIGAHILPYWEGVPADEAVAYVDFRLRQLRAAFPGKPIVLSEMGWPSDGARIGGAVATRSNQAKVVRAFVDYATRTGLDDYFVIEAFDQPWKGGVEGLAGAYWGVFDADRVAKFAWTGPVVDRTTWPLWAALAALLGLAPVVLARRVRPQLGLRPVLALALIGQAAGGMLAVSILIAAERYMSIGAWAVWSVLFVCMAFLFLILTVELVEAAALLSRPRVLPVPHTNPPSHWPKVSIHVPCCNEPPALVRETLNALSRLDYPDFEVVVVDNNTKNRTVSEAIAAHCRALGPRFRFLHLPHCPGYKAGALNRALDATATDASVIAVVDSDYVVEPHWLKSAIPFFAAPEVGLVQAPQDYRDANASGFKMACYWEYQSFFRLGMVFRSEDDAIIQHGTMTLVRRSALKNVGGWDENCITEDAELGFRLFADGWKSVYLPVTFGRGIMPDDAESYGRQRHRWVFGAMQILRTHRRLILGRGRSRLTGVQRYHFVAGWLPWIGDGIGLIMAGGSIVWATLSAIWPAHFEPPQTHFLLPVLTIFIVRQVRLWWLYRRHVHATAGQRTAAMLAGVSLTHRVARAVLTAFFRVDVPFRRTPKAQSAPKLIRSILAVREEIVLLAALGAAIAVLIASQDVTRLDVRLWIGVLVMQAWPYVAAVLVACQAAWQRPAGWAYRDVAVPRITADPAPSVD
ncbi:MAG: glycosyltransferase [Proteobacteria bacterium]|nr:glycosyltransferase [Pseudomonadota bacterium]